MITLSDRVDIHRSDGRDSYGVLIQSEVIEDVPCKFMYSVKNEELRGADGKVIQVKASMYFEGLYHIKPDDRLHYVNDFGESYVLEVLDRKPIKDFSDVVLYTRVIV